MLTPHSKGNAVPSMATLLPLLSMSTCWIWAANRTNAWASKPSNHKQIVIQYMVGSIKI